MQTLEALNIQNKVGHDATKYLGNLIRNNQVTSTVSLHFQIYRCRSAQTLIKLEFNANEIGPIGANYLADGLYEITKYHFLIHSFLLFLSSTIRIDTHYVETSS